MAQITDEELKALERIGDAFNRIMALPEIHPADKGEFIRDIHDIQNRILARVGLRAMREREEEDKEKEKEIIGG